MKSLFFFFTILFSLNSLAVERVLDFHSSISIEKSGELLVTESIAVEAEGREIRRGLLRDFPTTYRDSADNVVKVPFTVVRVTRNGRAEPYSVEPLANGTRIRIGAANVFLAPGRYAYEIVYRTGRQIGFFSEHDELYWNVNGNGWTFAFDAISAEVALPAAVPAERIKAEAYTGRFGDRGRDYRVEILEGKTVFTGTRKLAAREGLTIVVSFPKGVVAEPSRAQRAKWFLEDNRGVASGVAGIAFLMGFLWWRWALVGRDPRAGPMFPRYEAPPGVGPAGARYVHKMGFDDRCFAAALLGLGERGVVKIRGGLSAYGLERTDKTPAAWLPGEKAVLAQLLPKADTRATIGKTYDPMVAATRSALRTDLTLHFGERLFSKNHGSFVAGIAIAAVAAFVMDWYAASSLQFFTAIGVMILVLLVFKRILPAYSVEGRKLEDAIVGLRQYLSIAEADELRRYKAPPQTAEEFAKFLPYAVALDVEKTWADRFAGTLGAAAVTAAVSGYYSTEYGLGRDNLHSLTSSLSGLGDTVSSAATAPGSSSGSSSDSGGGGGGSSGGGGGGGGGSGW